MSEATPVVDHDAIHSTTLVQQYEQDYQDHRKRLNLPNSKQSKFAQKSAVFSKLVIGSFLALCAVSTVVASNYIDYQVQELNRISTREVQQKSWVFPVYFMAGVFSVSSIFVFRRTLK